MTTLEWLQGFAQSLLSLWLAWPLVGLLLWAVFAVRIGRVHHVRLEDIPERGEEIKT